MRELARRLKPHGIVTASTNPGAVVSPLTHGRVDELFGWTPKVSFSLNVLLLGHDEFRTIGHRPKWSSSLS